MRDPSLPAEWRALRPGLLLMAGITATLLVIFFLDEVRRAVEEGPRLYVVTQAAPRLQPGSVVWVAGRPAGRVLSVRFRDPDPDGAETIVIEAVVERYAVGVIREDASARIVASGLMAPVILSVRPGSPARPPFDFADTLRSTVALVDQDRALALVDTLRAELARARPAAARLRAMLENGGGTLAALRRDTSLAAGLEHGFRRLEALLYPAADEESGSLARLAADTALATRLERIGQALRRLAAERDSAETETAVEALLAALSGLQSSLAALEYDLQAGRGALGRFLYDSAVLRERVLLEARTDSLRLELLRHPLRWLRFRLF